MSFFIYAIGDHEYSAATEELFAEQQKSEKKTQENLDPRQVANHLYEVSYETVHYMN